nr:SPOR domain-containing protein [Motiliproteus sp. SC1-56]
MLLDGEGYRQRQLNTEIPPAPEAPPWAEFEPETTPLEETTDLAPPRPQPDPAPVVATTPKAVEAPAASEVSPAVPTEALPLETDPPVLDTQGVPVAWTLQLASFRDHGNASKLQARLVKAGYKAYLRQKSELTQVFVGPDVQRSSVEQLRQRLKRDFNLDGLVLRFRP